MRERLSSKLAALFMLALVFLIGTVAGCLAALYAVPREAALGYMTDFINQSSQITPIDWRGLLTNNFFYPVLAFLLGYTLLGVALIPLAVCARGFFLSFAVTICARVYGGGGLLLAVGLQGIPGLLSIPCLFFLAVYGFDSARKLLKRSAGTEASNPEPLFGATYLGRFAVCSGMLLAVTAYDAWLSGHVINLLKPFIL